MSEIIKCKPDVKDFIAKLEPNSFKMKGGNKASTDISNLIDQILEKHGKDTVSILISDFVFSPGSGKNAEEYLINQQIGIKRQFVSELKSNDDLSFMMYALTSNFDGKYYDKNNHPYKINQQRPFYIMTIGDKDDLINLSNTVKKSQVKGSGVLHSYQLSTATNKVNYGIVMSPKVGRFSPDPSSPKTSIVNAKVDKKHPDKKFMVSIAVDFSSLLLDDEYILDSQNYKISNKAYELQIEKSSKGAYTHLLKLSLKPSIKQIVKGSITISLLKKNSTWVEECTSTDDTGLDLITTNSTYGFKYLVDGVYDAYHNTDIYTKFNVNIK